MQHPTSSDFIPLPHLSDDPQSIPQPQKEDKFNPFPDHSSFQTTCRAYVNCSNFHLNLSFSHSAPPIYRTGYEGYARCWEWKEHPKVEGYGYVQRRVTRYIAPPTSQYQDDSHSEGEGLEDEDVDVGEVVGRGQGQVSNGERVEVELGIIYSRTYRIPMLCVQAYDQAGTPLPLSALLSSGIIKPPSSSSSSSSEEIGRQDVILLPDSPFPLIQQIEHPTTGLTVWSIHPCHVGDAVAELLSASASDRPSLDRDENGTESENGGENQNGSWTDVFDKEEVKRLEWFERWLQLSGSVVDLSYP